MGSVHARGDTFLTFGFKALTETNTSRLATELQTQQLRIASNDKISVGQEIGKYLEGNCRGIIHAISPALF
jgi:hypothetical protein